MKNMTPALPGITYLGIINSSLLPPHMAMRSVAGIPSLLLTEDVEQIDCCSMPTVTIKSEVQNGGTTEQATLKFSVRTPLRLASGIAFAIRTASGELYVLGSREKPVRSCPAEWASGTPGSQSSVVEYTITYKDKIALHRAINDNIG